MGAIASQTTSLTIVYSTVYSEADQKRHQSSASLAFLWGIHRGEFPAQMASNAENVSIWWRHHAYMTSQVCTTILHICIWNRLVLIAVKFLIVSLLFGSAELDLELFQIFFITMKFICIAKCLYVLPFICKSLLTLFVYVPATLNSDVIVHNSCMSWWRHHMETFSALLALCAMNKPVTGKFPL